ncbi:hypothetical protein BC828DRAFT_388261 [Blastocladiella britannica]|nr:hypothetical protein BC828DRAFT_388261 [Blastocladiella britannica]
MDRMQTALAMAANHELLHRRVVELEAQQHDVESLRARAAITADYEFKHGQLLALRTAASARSKENHDDIMAARVLPSPPNSSSISETIVVEEAVATADVQARLDAAERELVALMDAKLSLQHALEAAASATRRRESKLEDDVAQMQLKLSNAQVQNHELMGRVDELLAVVNKLQSETGSARAAAEQVIALQEVNGMLQDRIRSLQDEMDSILEKNMSLVMDLAQYQ